MLVSDDGFDGNYELNIQYVYLIDINLNTDLDVVHNQESDSEQHVFSLPILTTNCPFP